MGWIDEMGEHRAGPTEFSTLKDPKPWLLEALGGASTTSGERVSEEKALRLSSVYACVRLLAETASLPPLRLLRRVTETDDEGRQVTRRIRVDHLPEARVIRNPNSFMTEASFRETLTAHLALWRNCYAEIERDGADRPLNLWPVPPWRASVEVVDGQKVVVVDAPGPDGREERRTLWPGQYIHLHALSLDGLRGRPLLSMGTDGGGDARDAVGLSLAMERDAALYYRQGMKMQGYWVTEGSLEDDARDLLEQELRALTQGLDNFHRTALLEEGVEWKAFADGSTAVAQLQAMRVFQVQDIARFFGITQLHKLGDLSRATFSNIGEQREEFHSDTMMVYFVRWEQFVGLQLLPDELREDHYFKFNVRALLRGSFAEELESLRGSVIDGIITLDEARAFLDLDPYPDGIGALPRFQLNTATAQPGVPQPGTTPAGAAQPAPSTTPTQGTKARQLARAVVQALRPQLRRSAEHYTRREARVLGRLSTRHADDPQALGEAMWKHWEELPGAIRRELGPVVDGAVATLEALGGDAEALRQAADAYRDEAVDRHLARSRVEVAEGVTEDRLEAWENQRAADQAGAETNHLADRLIAAAFDDGGSADG